MKKAADYKTARGLHNHYLDLIVWCLTNNQIRLGVEMLMGRVRHTKDVKGMQKLIERAENLKEK